MYQIIKKISILTFTFLFIFLSGTPVSFWSLKFKDILSQKNIVDTLYLSQKNKNIIDVGFKNIKRAEAATFSIQTGYYVGNATDNRPISGLGFQPNMILLKDNDASGNEGVIFKTSSMSGETSLALSETDAVLTTNHIQSFNSDGFTIGNDSDVNTANIGYYYTAFGGSDCSASGTFCVGSYSGNGTSQSITSVGFQPDLVIVKRSGATQGVWKSSSMSGTTSNYFDNINELASGGITSLNATGFSVGNNAAVNTSANTYFYAAFKEVSGALDVGTYSGNATDNRPINTSVDSNLNFEPNLIWVKNASAATPQVGVLWMNEHYGDRSLLFTDLASTTNSIQSKLSEGFEIGTTANVNSSGVTYYYAAFGGAVTRSPGNGTYTSATGSYSGTGSGFSITGLGFDPDLVIIKHNDQATDQHAVFRTKLMSGDRTHFFSNAASVFTGGITSLDSDGFTVGINAAVNTAGDTYYWSAFGNAMRTDLSGGSSDFLIGQYIGTGRDNVKIDKLPISPDFVTIKRVGATFGTWRTSNQSGDNSIYFSATAAATNLIQSFNSDGFTIGTNGVVNASGAYNDYFAFKYGNKFTTNTYQGNATVKDITNAGFQPDLLWIKKTTGGTARGAVLRTSAQTGNAAQPFLNTATLVDSITNLIKNGFSLGTGVEVNETGNATYQYAAWNFKKYDQRVYRLFSNVDSTDVGSPLAASNTSSTLSSSGQAFRLRLLTRVDDGNLYSDGRDFKLQYVDKGSGSCSSPSGGNPSSYTDVTGATLIAYNNNATPSDGSSLTSNANDPIDSGRTIINQTYEELNNFSNTQGSVMNGQTMKFDFSLIDNGASANTNFCFRIVRSDDTPLETYTVYPEITTAATSGSLSVDIVDSGGVTVGSPSVSMSPISFSFTNQTSTGTFGTSSQKIRVDNATGTATWTLSLAANSGPTALWNGSIKNYDFNDPTANATDGGDADSFGGQMNVNPSTSTITPKSGCTLTNIASGSSASFNQGVTDSITLASASSGANTNCHWDITGIGISQTIPKEQPADASYNINMTLSIIAS